MFDVAEVGSAAPELSLSDDKEARHRPRVLAFVRAWSFYAKPLDAVRERLAELDAELVIVSAEGAWSFTRDHEPVFCDRLAADITTAAAAYGVHGDAIFVIDHRGVMRFAHRPDCPVGRSLVDALDAATEALCWRQHQTRLERVQWSPREWASKCLVVGCALTFDGIASASRTRFARGTGPVCTPHARTGAPMSRPSGISERPTLLSPRRDD